MDLDPGPRVPRYLVRFSTRKLPRLLTDTLVIGSGVAGLRAAIEASRFGKVVVVTKTTAAECNTHYAQGGIAAALSPHDAIESHVADTLQAGQGICDRRIVRLVVARGIPSVREIIDWGARFDTRRGELHFTREGGHSMPRILHAGGDATGQELERALLEKVASVPQIQLLEKTFVVDLLTQNGACHGALLHDEAHGLRVLYAASTILASGGLGCVYRETTNPSVATGDGMACSLRAGATLQDMEFVQFHPTTLYVAGASRSLISEAVRGEGALLRDHGGKRFMPELHEQAELAPRDVVSRGIIRQMKLTGDTSAFLDLTHLPAERVRRRFPTLWELCATYGIDISKEPIPVRPSAHYMVGGVRINARAETRVAGLYACGEAASSGLHGANRLGSNSLLEGLVFGEIAGREAGRRLRAIGPAAETPIACDRPSLKPPPNTDLLDVKNSLRSLMWRSVGVEREDYGLREALSQIEFWYRYFLEREFERPEGWELGNLLTVANAITRAALARTETRGVHYRTDFPERDDARWTRHSRQTRKE
ncbi:MAG: L-aspartate oxidase [Planctomycetes bacterium]|nr:L-aspartate oxidase [Planctomycetota bacterium]